MRLARFRTEGVRIHIGLVVENRLIDVTAAIPSPPIDMVDFLEEWDVWSDRTTPIGDARRTVLQNER